MARHDAAFDQCSTKLIQSAAASENVGGCTYRRRSEQDMLAFLEGEPSES